MPIRQTDKGWYWGSKGPFKTKKKALAVQGGAYASGYKESREHLTKEVLVEFVDEVMGDLDPMQGGWGGVTGRGQKKHKPTPSVERAEDAFIGSVLGHRYASLDYKEQVALEQKLKKVINDAIDAELDNFERTPVYEEREYGPGSYDYKFAHKPENKRKHAARNRANRAAVKAGRKKVGDGKDVHHPKGHSDSSPTQVMPQSQNRGMEGEGGRKKK